MVSWSGCIRSYMDRRDLMTSSLRPPARQSEDRSWFSQLAPGAVFSPAGHQRIRLQSSLRERPKHPSKTVRAAVPASTPVRRGSFRSVQAFRSLISGTENARFAANAGSDVPRAFFRLVLRAALPILQQLAMDASPTTTSSVRPAATVVRPARSVFGRGSAAPSFLNSMSRHVRDAALASRSVRSIQSR